MTPLQATRKHCLACVENAKEVKECPNDKESGNFCELHSFRFGKNPSNRTLKLKAIKTYCRWCMGGLTLNDCTSPECNLFLFRFGKSPNYTKKVVTEI